MSRNIKQFLLYFLLIIIAAYTFAYFLCFNPDERKVYDLVMLWINFSVLVVLFIKFAKKPLMDFIRSIRAKIDDEISLLKKNRNDINNDLEVEETKIRDIHNYLDTIRMQIIAMGEKEKENIIAQAKLAAQKMVENARNYAKIQMDRARKQLSDEMVDIAISTVEDKMKAEISKEDHDKLISDFLINLEATKPHLN